MTETSKNLIAEYYALHLGELRAFVAKCTGSPADSEDMVQTIFLRLLQTDKMISAVTLPCLVYSAARNIVADYWRHRKSVERHETYVKSHCDCGTDSGPASVYAPAYVQAGVCAIRRR